MSVTLTSSISATTNPLPITGDVTGIALGMFFAIGDEIVELLDFEDVPDVIGQTRALGFDHNSWIVRRGAQGTTAASHGSGATVYAARSAYATNVAMAVPSPLPGAHTTGSVIAADSGATWVTTGTAAPGTTLTSGIVLDSTNKDTYVWNGTAYVKVSDYTTYTAAQVVTAGSANWYSEGTAAPGTAYASALYLDSTNKHLYVWNGAAYVKVSDYA